MEISSVVLMMVVVAVACWSVSFFLSLVLVLDAAVEMMRLFVGFGAGVLLSFEDGLKMVVGLVVVVEDDLGVLGVLGVVEYFDEPEVMASFEVILLLGTTVAAEAFVVVVDDTRSTTFDELLLGLGLVLGLTSATEEVLGTGRWDFVLLACACVAIVVSGKVRDALVGLETLFFTSGETVPDDPAAAFGAVVLVLVDVVDKDDLILMTRPKISIGTAADILEVEDLVLLTLVDAARVLDPVLAVAVTAVAGLSSVRAELVFKI